MKILYLSRSYIPSESANTIGVLQMCNALLNQKITLDLVLKKNYKRIFYSESQIKKYIKDNYGLSMNCKIIAPLSIPYLDSYNRYIEKKIIDNYDIIYTRFPDVAYYAIKNKKKCILELHRIRELEYLKLIINNPNLYCFTISNALRKDIYKLINNRIEKNIHVIHDAVNLKKFEYIPSKINPNIIRLGYVGNLSQGRGLDIIISAFKNKQNYELHIYGGDNNQLKYWKVYSNSYNNIFFHGRINHNKIPNLANNIDIFLMPYKKESKTHNHINIIKWTSPLKMFEFMAMGKPIISSTIPVLKEVLKDEHNAILIDEYNDPNEWYYAAERLVSNGELRKQIVENARNDVILEYNWEKRAQKVLETIQDS